MRGAPDPPEVIGAKCADSGSEFSWGRVRKLLRLSEARRDASWWSIIGGAGYRLMRDRINNTSALAFLPPDRNLRLFSGFIQDRVTIVPDRFKSAVGAKLEHNDYSGYEFQPSARLAWTPDENQTIWGAVSRAVRSPSRIDTDAFIPAPSPTVPEYCTLDARLAWQYRDVEVSLVGQNLTESRHREFGIQEIPRAVYGKVTLRF
jgi:hypothetical protein